MHERMKTIITQHNYSGFFVCKVDLGLYNNKQCIFMTQQMYAHSFRQPTEENSTHVVGRCLPRIVKEDDFGLVGWVVKVGRGNRGYMGLKAAAKVQSN